MENDSERKQHFRQHKGKHSNSKEAYTGGSNSKGRKVGFATVIAYITRRGPLLEEVSIHTVVMKAIREIQKSKDVRWVINTDLLSSMLAIENNRQNHPILNQIYDILTELHNQRKKII